MRFVKRFLITAIIGIPFSILMAMGTVAAMPMHGMHEKNLPENTLVDRNTFISIWNKAFAAGSFTPEQTKRLADELADYSRKLAENYMVLDYLWQREASTSGNDLMKVRKRIELKEKERGLIALQAKLNLESFLTKKQADMVLIAVFQEVSLNTSGNEYLNQMHREMNRPMDNIEQLTMDLGRMAEKYNRKCQAETLELIRDTLWAQFKL